MYEKILLLYSCLSKDTVTFENITVTGLYLWKLLLLDCIYEKYCYWTVTSVKILLEDSYLLNGTASGQSYLKICFYRTNIWKDTSTWQLFLKRYSYSSVISEMIILLNSSIWKDKACRRRICLWKLRFVMQDFFLPLWLKGSGVFQRMFAPINLSAQ